MTKFKLSRIAKIFTESPAGHEETAMPAKNDDNGVQGGLTLQDRELIGIIETIDRRVASLEHDLWVVRGKIEALGGGVDQAHGGDGQ